MEEYKVNRNMKLKSFSQHWQLNQFEKLICYHMIWPCCLNASLSPFTTSIVYIYIYKVLKFDWKNDLNMCILKYKIINMRKKIPSHITCK